MTDDAHTRMREAAALWSVGEATATELIDAACALLVAGRDGYSLAMLAGVHSRQADAEVPDLLEAALHDVGLRYYPRGSRAGLEAALRALAARTLAGSMSPMDLAAWAHLMIGHDTLPLADRLVELDDAYGILDYGDGNRDEFDDEVLAQARQILGTS